MKRITLRGLLLLFSFLLTFEAFAETKIQFKEFTVENLDDAVMQQVARRFEVIRREGARYTVLVPSDSVSAFLNLAPEARLVAEENNLEDDPEYFAGYRDIAEVEATLKKFASEHPDIARLETYGQSREGRPLYVLKISDNVALDEADEPRLLLDAATHGDEIITTEVLLRLLEEMVNGYGTDARLSAMVDKAAIYFVPVINPDGFAKRNRYAEGVDPNRQYPYPENPNRRPIGIIQSIMDLVAKHQFKGSIDFHAYGEMVMYPWAYTHNPIDDVNHRAELANLTNRMAELNRYAAGPIADVIYIAEGSSADYYYWKHQTRAIAVEMGHSKSPSSTQIPGMVNDVREMTWRFVEHFIP